MNRYGSIYIVTNTATDEQYVGQTCQKAAAEHLGVTRSGVTEAIKRKGKVKRMFTLVQVA